MSRFRVRHSALPVIGRLVFILTALLLATPFAHASGPPYGVPSGAMPWEWSKYLGYREPPGKRSRPAQPATVAQAPAKYKVNVTRLPDKHTADDPNAVVMMAHLPEGALLWVDDTPTRQTGKMRWFESPPVKPGQQFHYNVRVVWYEDGKWVSETVRVPVKAGDIQCVDIIGMNEKDMAAEVAANLAKLDPEDRKLVEEQRFCAVQNDKVLGSMGVPAKVMVKGQPVFLCCEGCSDHAQKTPDRTLEKVRELKAKTKSLSPE